MATKTQNLGLTAPQLADQVGSTIPALAANMSAIDAEFGQRGINVKWFGAKGDGVTDDTQALFRAWNAASSAGCALIYPAGTYLLSSAAAYPTISNVYHIAQGPATIKIASTASNTNSTPFFQNWSNCVFDGLTFTAPNQATNLFSGFSTNNLTFRYCTIIDCSPLFMDGAGDNITFFRCNFTESPGAPYGALNQTIGNCTGNFYVLYCSFNFTASTSSGAIISANHGNLQGNYWIIGNRFFDQNAQGKQYITDAAIDIEPPAQMNMVVIRDNEIYDSKIYLSSTNHIVVENNNTYRTQPTGLEDGRVISGYTYVSNPGTAGEVIIKNNRFSQVVDATAQYYPAPILWQVPTNRLIIKDNYFFLNQSGAKISPAIQFNNVMGVIDRVVIEGNIFEQSINQSSAAVIGMTVNATNYIKSLMIRHNRVKGQWQHLLGIGGTAATVESFRINDNDLSEFTYTAQFIYDGSSSTYTDYQVMNNIGYNPSSTFGSSGFASGTTYQNNGKSYMSIYLPTWATTSGTAGTVAVAMGPTSGSLNPVYTRFVSGSTTSSLPEIISIRIPPGWYYKFTASGATLGTGTIVTE